METGAPRNRGTIEKGPGVKKQARNKHRRWYSISVDTLRFGGLLVVALAVLGLAFVGYRAWREAEIEKSAGEVLEEVGNLFQEIRHIELRGELSDEREQAWYDYQQAQEHHSRGEFRRALDEGESSLRSLYFIQESLGRGAVGEAEFMEVHGGVEFRRGETGRWQPARTRVVLRSGDHVRTSKSGSADIVFLEDGTMYNVRPESQVVIRRRRPGSGGLGEQEMEMEYGWVNLDTAKRPGKVRTPEAEAEVEGDSRAFVGYDRDSRVGRFGAYRGELRVGTGEDDAQTVGELQQVVQRDGHISEPQPLPPAPELASPQEHFEIDMDRDRRLVLEWAPVEGAGGYAVQVAENVLFADNVVEDLKRSATRATLGIQGEGFFFWRVAALARDGSPGPWSPVRRFRVVSPAGRSSVGDDRTPPKLELTSITRYGDLVMVGGATEPGATVTVNGEPATVAADGGFTKTVQFVSEGEATIEVWASDAWGNEISLSKPVLVEGL